jgi:hypothetical protein
MKDASKAANRLYGSSRIKQMQKVNNELEKEISLLEQKKKEAEGYLKDDEQALKDAVKDANDLFGTELELKFDTDGSVANYTAIMNSLIDLYNAKIDEYGKEITEQQKKQLEELKARIDAF